MGLVEDYLSRKPQLDAFYLRHPDELLSTTSQAGQWADGVADAVGAYQARLGAAKSPIGNEAVIATGQQPGIFTGPLYSIYKAITAIQLAARQVERHGTPCVPVFWVAGDDHDFEEVRTAHVLTRQFEALPLEYTPASYRDGAPMYRTAVDDSLHVLLDEAAARCGGSSRDAVLPFLHESIDAAESMSHWFAIIMARLFRDTPLLLFVPDLPEARVAAVPVLEREIAAPTESTRISNAAGEALGHMGYPQQVVKGADECNFFVECDGRRCKVTWDGQHFHVATQPRAFTRDEMLALLHNEPGRFSANVLTRPVVQQALFPVSAYVGGPGEIAYWLQLRGVFERHGYPMPIVYPRAQALLLDAKTRKLHDKFGFEADAWLAPPEQIESRALLMAIKNPALDALREHREPVSQALAAMKDAVSRAAGKDRSIAERADTYVEHTLAGLARLEERIAQADAQQADAVRAQARRVQNVLAPYRKPQERVYCILPWLFEHGWDFVPRLMESFEAGAYGVREIET